MNRLFNHIFLIYIFSELKTLNLQNFFFSFAIKHYTLLTILYFNLYYILL